MHQLFFTEQAPRANFTDEEDSGSSSDGDGDSDSDSKDSEW